MSSRLLSDQERDRFVSWLEMEADGDRGMIQQLQKLGAHADPVIKMMTERIKAYLIVARTLRRTESMTIGGTNEPDQS